MRLSHLTWEPPPLGLIKINVEAADKVALLSKLKPLHSCWRYRLLLVNNGAYVLFEGDSKGCLDPLISKDIPPDWSISNVISNIINICESCLSFSFHWVKPVCATLWLIQQQRLLYAPTCLFVSMMIICRQILSLLIRVDHPPFPLV